MKSGAFFILVSTLDRAFLKCIFCHVTCYGDGSLHILLVQVKKCLSVGFYYKFLGLSFKFPRRCLTLTPSFHMNFLDVLRNDFANCAAPEKKKNAVIDLQWLILKEINQFSL